MDLRGKDELSIGIVGCGSIARVHMRSIAEIPGLRLAAVADVNEASARDAAQLYGCRYFTDYRQMIREGGVDIVDICTPSGLRLDVAVYAAGQGKHIITEKPIEVTTGRIDSILTAARENGVTVHGIFGKRYADLYRWLRQAVDSGRMGELFFADIAMKWYRPPEYYQGTWRGTWALDGGGALMNQCIHYVDLMQWFMGMPVSAFAYTDRFVHTGIETEDTAAAVLRFGGGAMGMIQASTAMTPGFSARFSLHGRQGGIIIEDDRIRDVRFGDERPGDREAFERFAPSDGRVENVSTHIVSDNELHKRQLTAIADAVRKGVPSGVSGREARNAVEIIETIYRSAREGKEVFFSQNPQGAGKENESYG